MVKLNVGLLFLSCFLLSSNLFVCIKGCKTVGDKSPALPPGKKVILNRSLTPEPVKEGRGRSKTFINLKRSMTSTLIQERMRKYEKPGYSGYSKGRKPVGNKTYALGTNTEVYHDRELQKGFLSTVLAAYANHWTLVTSPEDWWFTIAQRVVNAIDSNSHKATVRDHFVAHQGKKELVVLFDRGLYSSNHSSFFHQMTEQVAENIKDPGYVSNMQPDFSTTTTLHGIIGNIAIMSSLQEFFEYTGGITCGIPEVEMKGTLQDWQRLNIKLVELKERLAPISDDIGLSSWWGGVEEVLSQLEVTYTQGNNTLWWNNIIERREEFVGCGSREVNWSGWFFEKFLGQNMREVHNGLVSVPLKITNFVYEEQSALVAGIAGFKLDPKLFTVEAEHVWNLLLEPNSAFRQ